MVDGAGQALIRGLDIDKVSKDMFEEALIFKGELKNESTSSRQIRWYQKTSGFITATAPAKISNIAYGARPFVLRQTWTRNTSFTKKYLLDSELIDMEDETDSDVQVFMNTAEDLTDAVSFDLDSDIWDVVSESQSPSNINDVTSTAAWDAASGQNPYADVTEAEELIRQQTKKNPVLKIYMNAHDHKSLKDWLVTVKGSSIPGFSSQLIENKPLLVFDSKQVVVSENVTQDFAMVANLERGGTYKEFKPLTTSIITEDQIGRKIRVGTNGIALLVRPKYIAHSSIMTLANLKKHHARLVWLASGEFTERDFDYKIAASDNPNGEKGEGGWSTMGEMKPARKQLIQQDAQRTLKIFERKYPEFISKKEEPKTEEAPKKPKGKKKEAE